VKWQNEEITDKINEWERLDSALYSLPYDTTQLLVRRVLKTRNEPEQPPFHGLFSGYLDLAAGRGAGDSGHGRLARPVLEPEQRLVCDAAGANVVQTVQHQQRHIVPPG
jgi:hypothetical protein